MDDFDRPNCQSELGPYMQRHCCTAFNSGTARSSREQGATRPKHKPKKKGSKILDSSISKWFTRADKYPVSGEGGRTKKVANSKPAANEPGRTAITSVKELAWPAVFGLDVVTSMSA